MEGTLDEYRRRRSFDRTPEPSGDEAAPSGERTRFVIQEHHARRLHWDLRLEHDGVLISWALPRGVPTDPGENRLAVRTEDHPLSYLDFHGEIPAGEYGAGTMTIWDTGTCVLEKLTDIKVEAVFDGDRVQGRYALFHTGENRWMIHRMDPPADPEREPMPEKLVPMQATLSELPGSDDAFGFEIKWDGVRAICFNKPGRLWLQSRSLREITSHYPEVIPLGRQLGAREAILDGELVAFDEDGAPCFQRLQRRMHLASDAVVRRRAAEVPVTYVIFDLLHLDGQSLLDQPYEQRRERLESLGLDGESWQTPAYHRGEGAALLAASRERGLEGVVAKRLESRYRPGRRSRDWLKIKNVRSQEMVIGGWRRGEGKREGEVGALVVGYWDLERDPPELRYAGRVGTGFGDRDLKLLAERLEPLRRPDSPFSGRQPPKGTLFAKPELVAQVAFSEWTDAGTLRQPSYKGLRDEVAAGDVIRESEDLSPI